MNTSKKNTGFAIALAWPQTYCKQPGAWYDSLLFKLGINKNHYYKVGHAAVVLINKTDKTCRYFDFGRYHSPFQHGRVRSSATDYDLSLSTKAVINSNGTKIENYTAILKELQSSTSFHGDGLLKASYTGINYEKSLSKALEMQNKKFIPYGPFKYKGSNCSRFVASVLNAGINTSIQKFKLNWLIPLTPTPVSNVKALKHQQSQKKLYNEKLFTPIKPLTKLQLKSTLIYNKKPEKLKNAHWLSGEGAGSWFDFSYENGQLKMFRYSDKGELECISNFNNGIHNLENLTEFKLTYPANCQEITFLHKNSVIKIEQTNN